MINTPENFQANLHDVFKMLDVVSLRGENLLDAPSPHLSRGQLAGIVTRILFPDGHATRGSFSLCQTDKGDTIT